MALSDTDVRAKKHSVKPAGDKYADGGGVDQCRRAAV